MKPPLQDSLTSTPPKMKRARILGLVSRIALPAALLVLGVLGYSRLSVEVPEEAQPRRERKPVETRVLELKREDYQVLIPSQGNVRAHGLVTVTPQVAGRVQIIHSCFEEGAFFAKGDVLLEIDPVDLQVALVSARAQVASAQLNLEKEEALAEQARLDWKDLGYEDEPSALVKREPQLKAARQGLLLAEAREESALRDLERTKLTAPFDGRVLRRPVGVGQSVGPTTTLAEIFATAYSEVRLPISTLNLRDVTLPEDASDPPLTVTLRDGLDDQSSTEWTARILRTEGALDSNTLELFAIARIEDPFALRSEHPPLRVGQPVIAAIPGKTLKEVFVIPREAISQLSRIRTVDPSTMRLGSSYIQPLHSDDDNVVFRDPALEDGTLLVLTRLVYAPDGGKVVILPEDDAETPPESVSGETTAAGTGKGSSGNLKP